LVEVEQDGLVTAAVLWGGGRSEARREAEKDR